ncbi:hypothetical protein AABM38_07220 [Heyndrickxia sp. MSNUG]|uniref:hypothetical protein n=1 Tax=Heyndrickxia sp. MSNUG TaxID=3136677 RepID=UPI003C2CFB7C
MFTFHFYVFFTLGVVLLLSIFLADKSKNRMTDMMGMTISMFLSMNVGLTSGIFLGTVHQGDLFYSTIFAMIIGAVSGTICCFKLGISSSIEGFMAGMMGGMMGAMLGEMLVPDKSLVLIYIFLTLSISSLFLYKILPDSTSRIHSLTELIKPIMMFIFISAYLLVGSQLGKDWAENPLGGSGSHKEHQDRNHRH